MIDADTPSQQRMGRLVSCEPAMIAAFDLMRAAAPTKINVLILGEHGTGKELAASAMHEASRRSDGPLVKINCAAIPSELLESELFGYRRGAFTGASTDKKGLLEIANKGSLLLDEIGEMPIHLQAKLLRVLQDREFRPLGMTTAVKGDFRLICSTNVNPEEQVRLGRLRHDLYFRLSTMVVRLPPLRERRRDIVPLAEWFLQHYAQRHDRELRGFEPAALQTLEWYGWPGNVRELEHVVERAVILSRGPLIGVADLGEIVVREPPQPYLHLAGCKLDDLERMAIEQTLELTGWNKRATAKLLGIHRPTLYNKLRKYKLWHRGLRRGRPALAASAANDA
jgi:two-component system, NtrC family, response regulator HydG